jgi:hypothetical protein
VTWVADSFYSFLACLALSSTSAWSAGYSTPLLWGAPLIAGFCKGRAWVLARIG